MSYANSCELNISKTQDQKPKAMDQIVECVPNFSEGRQVKTVERLAQAIASVETACVLNTHIDPDHNRSVITFVASREMIVEAAFAAVSLATELIDMRSHSGV